MSEIDDEALAKALDRIAMTPDGALLYAFLQKEAIGLPAGPDPSDGALRVNYGHRSLAHKMMGLMARGIDESGGRTDDSPGTGKRSERPVVFLTRKPASVGPRVSARDYIASHLAGTDD
jgi:hypothetical protein